MTLFDIKKRDRINWPDAAAKINNGAFVYNLLCYA